MNKDLIKFCTDTFFTHPDWDRVIELLQLYLEDLKSIDRIDIKGKSNDEVATELRARQLVTERFNRFIADTHTLKKVKQTVPKTPRKFK
jgi:hypothetical protein